MKIDSFDLAFLAMMGIPYFEDPFDRSFAITCRINKAYRHTHLWGPEVILLQSSLLREWRHIAGPYLQKIRDEFDTSGDISVNGKEVRRLLKLLSKVGKEFWKGVEPNVEAVMEMTQVQAVQHVLEQAEREPPTKRTTAVLGVLNTKPTRVVTMAQKDVAQESWQRYLRSARMDHVQDLIIRYPDKKVVPEIQRLVKIVETNPNMRDVDRSWLSDRIDKVVLGFDGGLESMSDVEVGKLWTNTALELGKQSKINEFMVVAEMDDRTCDVCFRMHGTVIALEDVDMEGTEDFPEVEDIDNISAEERGKLGLRPPFHPNCRCDVVMLWGKEREDVFEVQPTLPGIPVEEKRRVEIPIASLERPAGLPYPGEPERMKSYAEDLMKIFDDAGMKDKEAALTDRMLRNELSEVETFEKARSIIIEAQSGKSVV